jgi:glycosyltransferase involved in cell wall biosynthesis
MKIALIEPFFSGSHKRWAEELARFSRHEIKIFSLPGKYWKWRMHGAAISLSKNLVESSFQPDLILATDMLNLPVFQSMLRKKIQSPVAIYFHENQISYPWSASDPDVQKNRDYHYHFINYSSALCADKVFFNSAYHKRSFIDGLGRFLNMFPDNKNQETIQEIEQKSSVLYLGMDLNKFDSFKSKKLKGAPKILWNHRWEYDKNPELFFRTLYRLHQKEVNFELIVLGENYSRSPEIFNDASVRLKDKIIHFGFVHSFEEYAKWLWLADVLPVTNNQDFFGGSVVEAMYTECIPLLPNRLVYPEHLTDSMKGSLYNSDSEFEHKLVDLLNNDLGFMAKNIRSFVRKYDWQNMVEVYDNQFEALKL